MKLKKLVNIFKHPFFLLPNAPNFVISNIRDYQNRLGLMGAGGDFIDGPDLSIIPFKDQELFGLSPINGSNYKYDNGFLRATCPAATVFIRKASILGPQGWVLDKSGGFFEELAHSDRKGTHGGNSLYRRRRFPKKQTLKGSYITLVYANSTNWYHWMIQSLPRLKLVSEFLESIDGIIVPENQHRERMFESLRWFDIPESKIIVLGNRHIQVENLLVPMYFAQSNVPDWVPKFFKGDYFRSHRRTENQEMVFISRGDTRNRGCINEAEVVRSLETIGFKSYQLAVMSFNEQASLFYNAKIVVGAHGAGLSNTVFCQPGANLLEIFPSADVQRDLFHAVANAAKVNYWRLEGEPAVSNNIHSDFTVDIDELLDLIAQILS